MQTTKPRARWAHVERHWEISHPDTHVVRRAATYPRDCAARLLERHVLPNLATRREAAA
jgi:hypothetical protein